MEVIMETKIGKFELALTNAYLKDQNPLNIIEYILNLSNRPVLTTNFGPYSASLLHAVTSIKKDIKVIWCDSGYNTPHTYRYARNIIEELSLNMHIYTPKTTAGFRDITMGIPEVDTEAHKTFTHEVKLEPFERAFDEHQPDVWFTNIRQEQSEFRKNLDILHYDRNGVLKVSPFFYFTEFELENYLRDFELPNETKYYDPTKVYAKRECGLHL